MISRSLAAVQSAARNAARKGSRSHCRDVLADVATLTRSEPGRHGTHGAISRVASEVSLRRSIGRATPAVRQRVPMAEESRGQSLVDCIVTDMAEAARLRSAKVTSYLAA